MMLWAPNLRIVIILMFAFQGKVIKAKPFQQQQMVQNQVVFRKNLF